MSKFIKCKVCDKQFRRNHAKAIVCSPQCRRIFNSFEFKVKNTEKMTNGHLKLRFEILKRDDFTCQYCGRNVKDDGIKLNIDHIKPLAKNGNNTESNLVTACSDCNLGKSDVLLDKRYISQNKPKLGQGEKNNDQT